MQKTETDCSCSAPLEDAGPLPDSKNAQDTAFETDVTQRIVADDSIKRSATWCVH